MVRLIPLFPGLVALITFVLARPFSPPRRTERKLVALLAMLDKLPDTPQFARSRRQLELRTANAAARAAAGQHVPSPWATYLAYTVITVVAAVVTWVIWGSSDPTLFHWWAQLIQKLSLIGVVVVIVTGLWQRTLWDVHQRRRRATQQLRRRWGRCGGDVPVGVGASYTATPTDAARPTICGSARSSATVNPIHDDDDR